VVEESFFEEWYVNAQAGSGLVARLVTLYVDVKVNLPVSLKPLVDALKLNPAAGISIAAAHLFAGM